MQITGENLKLVRRGVELLLGEIHNLVATCPDAIHYADELDELEAEQVVVNRLLKRIDETLTKQEKPLDQNR